MRSLQCIFEPFQQNICIGLLSADVRKAQKL